MSKNVILALLLLLIAVSAIVIFKFIQFEKASDEITFHEDIAPIIYKNCSPCHRPQGAGPFPLTSFEQVKAKAKMIALVTKKRFMPPWPADPNYSHFIDEKVLSQEQIELINKWVLNGAPEGKIENTPSLPEYSQAYLGKPDLVVKVSELVKIEGDNKDRFMLMKVPFEIQQDTFIRAVEFVPGNKKLVHHVNGHLLRYDFNKKKNVFDGEKIINTEHYDYKTAYEKMKLAHDDGTYPVLSPSFVNYLPGVLPTMYPEGLGGFKVSRKSAIFLKNIHYGPTPKDETDESYFNIYFSSKAPVRPTLELQLGTLGVSEIIPPLVIPPDTVMTFSTQFVTPIDISVLTINPHMHLLGKKFLAYAINPIGDTIPLIRINNWDFRWQYFYTFQKPVIIPKGSMIQAVGTYDNTKDNPNNPFNPPQEVSEREASMRTTDEMFQFIITYLPYKKGDENIDLQKRD